MENLFRRLAGSVGSWRAEGYPCQDYPAIEDILEFAGETEVGELRYLRRPQLRALETYWYLRLIQGTPHIFDLYRRLFPPEEERATLIESLGVAEAAFRDANFDLDRLWDRVRSDDEFVRAYRLESLRETLTLDYPSYILALAMGAGKTVLIAAIIATEFAMALEYPEGPFVQNALVFAPGKTIIESLRELTQVPYERILPPRHHKGFAASVKLTFTRDGERDVPVARGSPFNVVVTNTEKIRIQKETIRQADLGVRYLTERMEEAKAEIANLRLQAIASLPHLAVFSDEAHHTYGQSLGTELKKVRKTVDYLSQNTNVLCVINTTGTPYFKRQPLKDVVFWYGLSQGIAEGILKDLEGNIRAYDFAGDASRYVEHVVRDFCRDYGDVTLPNGAPAKLAIYFPQNDDLRELKPVVDAALAAAGADPTIVLINTSDQTLTKQADIDAFNRLNDPAAPHRVILLVNKGTEGWNCPSLFACALARRLRTSNNFVLQAATRCLRQVPENTVKARVYLSNDNYGILDRQLRETYGETIEDLNRQLSDRRPARLVLRKTDVPPLVVTQHRTTVVRSDRGSTQFELLRPAGKAARLVERTYTFAPHQTSRRVLRQIEDSVIVETQPDTVDTYSAAVDLAATYRLEIWPVYEAIRAAYGMDDVPLADLDDLGGQIEEQTRSYEVHDETVEVALAMVKPEGFSPETDASGNEVLATEIVYPKNREHLLLSWQAVQAVNPNDFGFHYTPYDFDSNPERGLFEDMLRFMNLHPEEVEDIYFTGGITDPGKTDFFVEYRDQHGKWRRYTPDFLIRKKPEPGQPPGSGKVFIVEVKAERDRQDPVNGEKGAKAMAVERLKELNPDRIQYEMVFAPGDTVPADVLADLRAFIAGAAALTGGMRIAIDREAIAEFCRRWKITELAFFGSVLRDDFGPDSDVDVLVTFADEAHWGWGIVDAQEELSSLLGRNVDLVPRKAVEESESYIRRKHILETAEVFYVA